MGNLFCLCLDSFSETGRTQGDLQSCERENCKIHGSRSYCCRSRVAGCAFDACMGSMETGFPSAEFVVACSDRCRTICMEHSLSGRGWNFRQNRSKADEQYWKFIRI